MAKLHRNSKLKSAPIPTAYELLGVSPGADFETIYIAYKELALVLHPDKGGDGEKFARVTMAFSVIRNFRVKYDKQLRLLGRLNCLTCKGTGMAKKFVGRKLTIDKCSVCKGTGETK